jgi:hypothetical protein|tara:strand:- start:3398 stop:4309 length:912 start_codon:yes stop_codon:yes gene_type:complete
MIETGPQNMNSFHLAGIIPVAGESSNLHPVLPNCLAPVAADYTAIQNAASQCAHAGCETIWIVCNDDVAPAVKHVLGDSIEDPAYRRRSFCKYPSEHRIAIPIFYVPVHPKDRDRRDCQGWSVLHGALTAYHISGQMSKWIIPDRFFVAFPSGVYDPSVLRKHRKQISSNKGFFLSSGGQTIRDGLPLSFTFDGEDFKRYRADVRKKGTGGFYAPAPGEKYPSKRLPKEKRYSARYFSLDIVFASAIIDEAKVVETPWFYPLTNWEQYRYYLASSEAETIEKPEYLFSASDFSPIGTDIQQGE